MKALAVLTVALALSACGPTNNYEINYLSGDETVANDEGGATFAGANGVSDQEKVRTNPSAGEDQIVIEEEITSAEPVVVETDNVHVRTQADLLKYAGATVIIGELRIIGVSDLSALSEVEEIHGDLYIFSTTVTSLHLSKLHTVTGETKIMDNQALTDLTLDVLENARVANPDGTALYIVNNGKLSQCEVQALADRTGLFIESSMNDELTACE
jgi:hypothetical protein